MTADFQVSVVIPSVGRRTLARAVESVITQSVNVHEVVIVNDSSDQRSLAPHFERFGKCVRLKEVFTGGATGIGSARNRGILEASGEFIAHLDDDDIWLPNHIACAREAFSRRRCLAVYVASAIRAHARGATVVPTVRYRGRQSILCFLYGPMVWASRRRVLPCTTYVFRRDLGLQIQMDRTLRDKPDVWWLLEVCGAGGEIWQSRTVDTVWYEDPGRTAGRWTDDVIKDWARRLESLSAGYGYRYVVHVVGRYLVRRGDFARWRTLVFDEVLLSELSVHVDTRLIRAAEGLYQRAGWLARICTAQASKR